MSTSPHSTPTLETRLIALISDLKDAEEAADGFDDDTAFDLGCLLSGARANLGKARDLLDALPAFTARDAEPRSAAGVHTYA